jgi:hypothetical protein
VISPYGCPGNVPQQPAVSSSPPCRVCLCCPSRICFCPSSLHLVTMACAAVLVPHYLCVACLLCLSLSSLVCIIVPVFPSFGMRFCSLVSRSPVVVWCSFSFQNPCISVCGLRLRFCGHTPAHLRAVAPVTIMLLCAICCTCPGLVCHSFPFPWMPCLVTCERGRVDSLINCPVVWFPVLFQFFHVFSLLWCTLDLILFPSHFVIPVSQLVDSARCFPLTRQSPCG